MGEVGIVRILQSEEPGEEAEGGGDPEGTEGEIKVAQPNYHRVQGKEGAEEEVQVGEQVTG